MSARSLLCPVSLCPLPPGALLAVVALMLCGAGCGTRTEMSNFGGDPSELLTKRISFVEAEPGKRRYTISVAVGGERTRPVRINRSGTEDDIDVRAGTYDTLVITLAEYFTILELGTVDVEKTGKEDVLLQLRGTGDSGGWGECLLLVNPHLNNWVAVHAYHVCDVGSPFAVVDGTDNYDEVALGNEKVLLVSCPGDTFTYSACACSPECPRACAIARS